MRPILPGDLSVAARALMHVPRECRAGLARRLVQEAEAADRFRRRHRKAHALWGNGTLMAAALARCVTDEPQTGDAEFMECQCLVLEALMSRQA